MDIGLLLQVNKRGNKLYNKEISRVADRHGLTKTELDILLFLYRHPEYDTAREIVEVRGITKSYVSKAVDSLVKSAFLQAVADRDDRRLYHLILCPKSQPALNEAKRVQEQYFHAVMEGVSIEEQTQMEQIFRRILDNIKREENR
ncbi:MAG: MarR family winged helix-turn-helix transcriptional regulator [Massiliimalia sp.]|jgi:DNA-binding MarR family transcriptional regulator